MGDSTMAQPPRPSHPAPPPPRTQAQNHPPPARVEGSELVDPRAPKDAPQHPPPEETVAEEQRKRSLVIEQMGVEAWKAAQAEAEAKAREAETAPGLLERHAEAK
jgi:hypothetical protein